MTIYRPTITGGPAGDPIVARWAELIRIGYAYGGLDGLATSGTDEEELERFAAFLAGAGKPAAPVDLPTPDVDDGDTIYVFVGGDHLNARIAARSRGCTHTFQWRHITTLDDLDTLAGFDPSDLTIIELGTVDPAILEALAVWRVLTLDDVEPGRPVVDVDAGILRATGELP